MVTTTVPLTLLTNKMVIPTTLSNIITYVMIVDQMLAVGCLFSDKKNLNI